jgi:hypothetical protein
MRTIPENPVASATSSTLSFSDRMASDRISLLTREGLGRIVGFLWREAWSHGPTH